MALAVAAFGAASTPAVAQAGAATLPDIEDEVMCPICGTVLELSQAPQAERERAFIRRRIAEGMSKQEIKDALVAEYGSEVLAVPDTEGFDLVAWVLPGLALVIAAGGIGVAVRRWRGRADDGHDPPSVPPSSSRLDEDIARYDL